jgi:hypothetical protein
LQIGFLTSPFCFAERVSSDPICFADGVVPFALQMALDHPRGNASGNDPFFIYLAF